MEEIDYLFEEFFSDLKFYSTIDGDQITTDLVNLYDKLNELLNSLIRKLSLSSSDGKINQYINVCISSIKDLDFFKCEEYINVITEYNQHIFKDKSLADAMLEIRLAKGEIDYNIFPFIISQLHRLEFYFVYDDDDGNTKEVIDNDLISDYWYIQIYICHYFATKAINELSKLASDNENKGTITNIEINEANNLQSPQDSNNLANYACGNDSKSEVNNHTKKESKLILKNSNNIPKVVTLLEEHGFIEPDCLNPFSQFLNEKKTDPKINWLKYPNSLFYFFKELKQNQIIKITRWGVLNDGFKACSKNCKKPFNFKDARTSFSKDAPAKDIKDKLDSIIAEFCSTNNNSD